MIKGNVIRVSIWVLLVGLLMSGLTLTNMAKMADAKRTASTVTSTVTDTVTKTLTEPGKTTTVISTVTDTVTQTVTKTVTFTTTVVNTVTATVTVTQPGTTTTVSEQACKKGGYEELGFRNQGQCVKAANQAS